MRKVNVASCLVHLHAAVSFMLLHLCSHLLCVRFVPLCTPCTALQLLKCKVLKQPVWPQVLILGCGLFDFSPRMQLPALHPQ